MKVRVMAQQKLTALCALTTARRLTGAQQRARQVVCKTKLSSTSPTNEQQSRR
jgi:hypothetical protein